MIEYYFNRHPTLVTCSFDGGEQENCSFPLELANARFGTDPHTVNVTVFDDSGQSQIIPLPFRIADRKLNRGRDMFSP